MKSLLCIGCQSFQISRRQGDLMRRKTRMEGGREGWLKVEANSALIKSGVPVQTYYTQWH